VGPRAFLDAVVKRKIPSPRRESSRRTKCYRFLSRSILYFNQKEHCRWRFAYLILKKDFHEAIYVGVPAELLRVASVLLGGGGGHQDMFVQNCQVMRISLRMDILVTFRPEYLNLIWVLALHKLLRTLPMKSVMGFLKREAFFSIYCDRNELLNTWFTSSG
jgi:hypothetical protein